MKQPNVTIDDPAFLEWWETFERDSGMPINWMILLVSDEGIEYALGFENPITMQDMITFQNELIEDEDFSEEILERSVLFAFAKAWFKEYQNHEN